MLFSSTVFLSTILVLAMAQLDSSSFHADSHRVHQRAERGERVQDGFALHTHATQDDQEEDDHLLDHEAILGSRSKTREFDQLSPEEAKKRLRVLVQNGIDEDHDGLVTVSELMHWVLKSFTELALEEGSEEHESEDENGDGQVSWSEHLKGVFDFDSAQKVGLCFFNFFVHFMFSIVCTMQEQDSNVKLLLDEDRYLWKHADLNGDDLLDPVEFAAFHSPEEFERMYDPLVEQLLARRDTNKDGFVDFNEFIADQNHNLPDPSSEHYLSEQDKFHHEYDVDGDGRLNHQECLNWIVPNKT